MPRRPDAATGGVLSELAASTCSAPAARSDRMRDIVVSHVPSDRTIRLLDVGCGTGSLLFRLASALPDAELVGVDVSPANIQAAAAQQTDRSPDSRIRFEQVDYLEFRADPFDAIVTDGVLHLVPGDTAALVRKLAGDLRPGGVLVCAMPFDCAYNRVFSLVRRLLRIVRSPMVDRLILGAGRLIHGREMSDEGLKERVGYMYIAPVRMMNDRLAASFAAAGLHRRTEYAMESTSMSQLRHRVTVFERGPE